MVGAGFGVRSAVGDIGGLVGRFAGGEGGEVSFVTLVGHGGVYWNKYL